MWQRKRDAVLRLLRGEELETLSRALGVKAVRHSFRSNRTTEIVGAPSRVWFKVSSCMVEDIIMSD